MTFGELGEPLLEPVGPGLFAFGLRVGDKVAALLVNDYRTLEVAWGLQRSGLFLTFINTHLTADEAAYIVNDCGARVLIVSSVLGPLGEALVDLTPGVDLRVAVGDATPAGYDDYDDFVRDHPQTPLDDEQEGSAMLYLSGTTGRPKGIRRPLSGLPFGSSAVLVPLLGGVMGFKEGDVYLNPAPLYHSAPMTWSMTAPLGGTVVVMERFDPEDCLNLIEEYRVTHGQFVPTMFVRMLKLDDRVRGSRSVQSAVGRPRRGPCAPEVKRRMIEWWGPIIHEFYSGTEGGGLTWITSEEWSARPGSVGAAAWGAIYICDDDGNVLPAGEDGVVWFGGRENAFVYNNDPEKTKQTFNERGWSTLWDVGHLDEDGYLYLTDRKLFMIVSGGVNIYPQEIEDVLVLHPAVADVAVFGIPDAEMGEQVKAVIQPAPGAAPGPRIGRGDPRLLSCETFPLQVSPIGRLHRCHAPGRERQALQAPIAGCLLGEPHLEPSRLTGLVRPSDVSQRLSQVGVPGQQQGHPGAEDQH